MIKETKPSFRPDFVVFMGVTFSKVFLFFFFSFLSVFYYRTPHPHLLKTRPVSIVLSICMFYIKGETCLKPPHLLSLSLSVSFIHSFHSQLTF